VFTFLQVFLERIGCFSVEKELINLLRNQKAPFERSSFVQACGSVAWSRGLRVFAVHNGSDCLGYLDVSATLPRLNVSRGCLGGRGGQNVTDVYRFTSKEALPHSTDLTNGQFLHQLLFTLCSLITCIRHAFIPSPIEPFAHTFFAWSLRINESMNKSINQSFFHSFSQSIIYVSIYSLVFLFFCFCFFSLSLLLYYSVFVTNLTGLKATYLTFESVRVEWNPVPELFILGYKVLVQNTSFSQFVAWNVNSTLIESLHSNTSYVIKVFPVHGLPVEGIPPESFQSIIVTTKEDRGKNCS